MIKIPSNEVINYKRWKTNKEKSFLFDQECFIDNWDAQLSLENERIEENYFQNLFDLEIEWPEELVFDDENE